MSTSYAPPAHARRPHVSLRLVAVVSVAAALVGLGTWVLVDRASDGGGAGREATTLIDDFNAAINGGDENAIADLLAKDFEGRSLGDTAVGADTTATGLASASARGLRVERVAPVSVEGRFATTYVRYTEPGLTGTIVSVFQIADGKILRLWGFEPGVTPPFDNAVTR